MTHIYLVRHGETIENKQQILQGHLPGHLTEEGIKQAEALKDQLVDSCTAFDVLLVSDLKRTMDTAAIINKRLHLPIIPSALLRERDWGSYTGVSIHTAQTTSIPDDAESVEQMFTRARAFLVYVDQHFHGKRLLVIGHGLFNRTIQACLSGCTIRDTPRFSNCEVRHVCFDQLPHEWRSEEGQIVSAD